MPRVGLLIDGEPAMTEVIGMTLKRSFDEVYTATSGQTASEILEKDAVTHVVADYVLGADEPDGATFNATWCRRHPSIRFAAILTGCIATTELVGRPGLDAAIAKPHAEDVIRRLVAAA